ncbi:MAG: hypothetical protein QXF12_00960 [Candidatus Aenigmatarchaeota archaeon]
MYTEYFRSFNKSLFSYVGDKRLYEGDYYYGMLFYRNTFISNANNISLFKILSISDNFGYEYFNNVRFISLFSIAGVTFNYIISSLPYVYYENESITEEEEILDPAPENDLYERCNSFFNLCSRDDYDINNVNVTADYVLENTNDFCIQNEIIREYNFIYNQHNVTIDITINYILGNVYTKFIFVSEGGGTYISNSFPVVNGINNYSFSIPSYIGDLSGFLYVYIYKSIENFECQIYRKIFYTRRISNRKFINAYSYNCLNNINNYVLRFQRVLNSLYYNEIYNISYNSSQITPNITMNMVHFNVSNSLSNLSINIYPVSVLYSSSSYSFVTENFNVTTSQLPYIDMLEMIVGINSTYFNFSVFNIQSTDVQLISNSNVIYSNTYTLNVSGDYLTDAINYPSLEEDMVLNIKYYFNNNCFIECYYNLTDYFIVFDIFTNYFFDENNRQYNLLAEVNAYNHRNLNLSYVYTLSNVSSGNGTSSYSEISNTGSSSANFTLPFGGTICNDVHSFIGTDYLLVYNIINSNIITNQSTYTISYIDRDFLSQNVLQVEVYHGSILLYSYTTNVDSNNNLIYYPDISFYVIVSYQPYYNILDVTIMPVNTNYTIIYSDITLEYVQSTTSISIYNNSLSNNIGNGINFSTCLSDAITGIDYFYVYGKITISSPNYNNTLNLSFCFDLNRTLSPAANFDLPLCNEYHEDNSIILSHEIKYGLYNCGDYFAVYNYNSFTLHPNNDFTIETNIIAINYFIVHYKVHNGFNPSDYQRYRARIRGYTIPNYNLHFQYTSFQFFHWWNNLQRYYSNYLNGTQNTYPPIDNISRSLQIVGPPSSSLNFLDHYDWQGEQVLMFAVEYRLLNNSTPDLLLVVDIIRYDTSNQPECIVSRKSFIYKNPFRNNISITYKNINYDTLGFPIKYDLKIEWDLKNDEWVYLVRNTRGVSGSDCGVQWAMSFGGNSDPTYYSLYEDSYYNFNPSSSPYDYDITDNPVYTDINIQSTQLLELFSRFNSSTLCNSNNIDMVINRTFIIYSELWLTRIFIIPTEDYIFVFVGSYFLTSETITVIFSDINHTIACAQHGTLYMRPNRYYSNTHNNIDIQRPSFNYYLNINTLEVIKLNVSFNYTRVCSTFTFTHVMLNWHNQPSYFSRFRIRNLNINIRKLNDTSYNVLVFNVNGTLDGNNIGSQSIINRVIDIDTTNWPIIDPFIISYDNRPNTNNTDCTTYGYEIHSRDILSSTTSDLIFLFHLNDPDFVNYFLNTDFIYNGFYLFNFTNNNLLFTFSPDPFNISSPSLIPTISRHTPFYSHFKVKVTTTETSPGNYSIFVEFLADYLINDPSDSAVIGYVTYDNPATYTGVLDIYCNGNLIHTVNLTNASTYTYNTNDACLSPTSWQEKYILLRPTSPSTSYTFRDDQNRTYSCNQNTVLCMTYVTSPQIPPCPNGDCNITIQNDFQNVEAKMVIYYEGIYYSQINLSSNVTRQYNADLDTQDKAIFLLLEVPSGYNYTDISADVSIYDINTLSLVQSYNSFISNYNPNYQQPTSTLSNFNNKPVLFLYEVLSPSIQDGYYLLVTDIKYTDPVTSTTCCARRLVNILRVLQYRTLTLDIIHSGSCENSDTDTTLTLQEVLPYVPEDKVEYIIYGRNIQQTNYGTPQLAINMNNLQRVGYIIDYINIFLYPTTYPPNSYSNDLVLEYLYYSYPLFIEPEFILHITSDYFFAFCVFSVYSNNYAFSVVIGSNSFNTFNVSGINILFIISGINLINTNNVSYSLSYSNMGIIVNSSPFSYTCSGTYTVMQITKTVSLNRIYDIVSINGLQINISNNVNSVGFEYISNISLQSYNSSSNSFNNISNILTGYNFTITTTHSIPLSHNYQLTPTPNTGNTSCTFDSAYGTYLPIYQRTVLTNNASTYSCRFDIFDPNYVNYVIRFDYSVSYTYQSIPYQITSLYRIISHYTHYYVVVTIQNNGGNNNTITINFLCDYWETDGYNMTLLQQGQPAYYTGRIRFIRDNTVYYDNIHTNVSSVSFNCNDAQCDPTNTTNRYVILGANNEISSITAPGRETLQLTNNNVIGLCMRNS